MLDIYLENITLFLAEIFLHQLLHQSQWDIEKEPSSTTIIMNHYNSFYLNTFTDYHVTIYVHVCMKKDSLLKQCIHYPATISSDVINAYRTYSNRN